MTDARTGGRNPFWVSWFLFALALLLVTVTLILTFTGVLVSVYWILLICPIAWALVFGGLLHSSRTARRIRKEGSCSASSSDPS